MGITEFGLRRYLHNPYVLSTVHHLDSDVFFILLKGVKGIKKQLPNSYGIVPPPLSQAIHYCQHMYIERTCDVHYYLTQSMVSLISFVREVKGKHV